jgi:hypothetical protein
MESLRAESTSMKPTKSDRRLWHRLEGYSFHERPLTKSLVDRLVAETGHPVDVCYTLVEEYRRFMYLAGSSSESLSPSPIVDMVWRMHAEDENAYYNDFCPRILGRTIYPPEFQGAPVPLQEDPDYVRTLEYYAEEFGRPQVQFWPDPDFALERLAQFVFWMVGLAAFALALAFQSLVFAVFAILVVLLTLFLRWRLSSLPLINRSATGK